MPEKMTDLDRALAAHQCDSRLEISSTLAEVADRLGAQTHPYFRDGLGVWHAFPMEIEGFGELVVGGPDGMDHAGCSIWYKSSADLTDRVVASLLYVLAGDQSSLFLNPDDGSLIEPDPHLIKRPESLSARVLMPEGEITPMAANFY